VNNHPLAWWTENGPREDKHSWAKEQARMSTCIRYGNSYHRHQWNDGGVCMLCDHKSLWALNKEAEDAARRAAEEAREASVFENEGGATT